MTTKLKKNTGVTGTIQNYSPLYGCLTKNPIFKEIDSKNIGVNPKAAFMKGKEWPNESHIKIAFMKDDFIKNKITLKPLYEKSKADFVQQVIIDKLLPLVNLTFEWDVDIKDSDVRISFNPSLGSFSELGKDCLNTPKDQPTMNLGWLDNDTDYDNPVFKGTGIVILHEFGHLLGMIHEHSREDSNLDWNKDFVYTKLGAAPNSWSKEECNEQIFEIVKKDSFNGSEYDKYSVMHYYFPSDYFKTQPDLPKVIKLSDLDKIWIQKQYPGKKEGIPLYVYILGGLFILVIIIAVYFAAKKKK